MTISKKKNLVYSDFGKYRSQKGTGIKMNDLHTHILPYIDDGAGSLEEALQMIESLHNQNIVKAVCTPHFDPTKTSLQEFINNRRAAMELMSDSKIPLIAGSETVLHDYLFHYSDLSELCIENTNYLLVELPYREKWDKKEYENLEELINYYDIIPIIAHVERYPSIKKNAKCVMRMKIMGCVIQLNTSSLIVKKSKKNAFRYIKQGYIDVIGSDCHNMNKRPPVILDALNIINHKFGINYCNQLIQNAELIVNGIKLSEKSPYIIR